MKLVLKIGGSIFFKDGTYDSDLIAKYALLVKDLLKNQEFEIERIAVVIGGGSLARNIVSTAKKISPEISIAFLDFLGIQSARLNAELFIAILGDLAYPMPPKSFEDAVIATKSQHKIIVAGGFQPGQSTNAVSAILAELLGADILINVSDVSQVYDKDPQEHPDAKPLEQISHEDFVKLILQNQQEPGKYQLYDLVGAEILKRSKIPLFFVSGTDPNVVYQILRGENPGTVVGSFGDKKN